MRTEKWEAWPYLADLLGVFLAHKDIIILKARQLGISWLVVGYCLWRCLFYENVKVLFLSQGQTEAEDLVGGGEAGSSGKAKFIYLHLPPFLQSGLGRDTQALIDFPATGSSMLALPSTDKAGRSTDATIVVRDEVERHPYAEENFASIGPTVDAGAQSIDLTTTNKLAENTHFKERYHRARLGESGAYPVFLPASLRPGRDEAWWQKVQNKYPAWQVEQEYPMTESEALGTIESVAFFELDALSQMLAECTLKPIDERHNGQVKIYKPPIIGRQYFSGIDISDGRYDFTAMPIMDWQTNEVVATFHAKIPADEATYIMDELGREYNNALLAPERNQPGLAVINKLKDLGYPNLYYMAADKPGWWTAGGKSSTPTSRGAILHELRDPLAKREIVIYNPAIIKELETFWQPQGDIPQAKKGCHDDWVIAMAITWQMRKHIQVGDFQFKSFTRKEIMY
jgi:hypothetical protein